jgi:hypothetical protein
MLAPVENRGDGRGILWDEGAQVVEYYHQVLDDRDIVIADRAAAESYNDGANGVLFQTARGRVRWRRAHRSRSACVSASKRPTMVHLAERGPFGVITTIVFWTQRCPDLAAWGQGADQPRAHRPGSGSQLPSPGGELRLGQRRC